MLENLFLLVYFFLINFNLDLSKILIKYNVEIGKFFGLFFKN